MAQVFTDDNFEAEVLKSKEPVMVDFYADWCCPCKMMTPAIEELAKEFEGKWKIGKLNVDDAPNTSFKYQVQSIPTIMFFKDGQVVDKAIGFQVKDKIKARLA